MVQKIYVSLRIFFRENSCSKISALFKYIGLTRTRNHSSATNTLFLLGVIDTQTVASCNLLTAEANFCKSSLFAAESIILCSKKLKIDSFFR